MTVRLTIKNNTGLTLLEVIVALALTGIMLGILLGAMRLAYRSEEKGSERAEVAQRMRIITDRLTWLIRGAYPYVVKDEETQEEKLAFEGAHGSLSLVTTSVDPYSHGPIDNPGLKWISIFAENGLSVQEGMFYTQELLPDKKFVIDPTVQRLEFSYLYALGTEEAWSGTWNTEEHKCLPAAIKATVSIAYKGQEYKMPPVIVSLRAGQCVEEPEDNQAPDQNIKPGLQSH